MTNTYLAPIAGSSRQESDMVIGLRGYHLLIDGLVAEPWPPQAMLEWLEGVRAAIGMTCILPPTVQVQDLARSSLMVIAQSHISLHISHQSKWGGFPIFADIFSCLAFDPSAVSPLLTDVLCLCTKMLCRGVV